MRVQMLRLMSNPRHGTVPAGAVIDLPAAEARKRIAAGDCKPLEDERRTTRAPNEPATPKESATTEALPVEKMTVEQLRAYAAAEDIDLGNATLKADVLGIVVGELERRRDADDD
ncbi:hypothetical protein [Streptomyces sp. NPDC002526]